MAGVRHIIAPPPIRRPTNPAPDPTTAGEMLVDENQRMAEEKRRAKLAERMRDREDTLAHMSNYGMGGADGRGDQDMQQLVRNQQQNLQQVAAFDFFCNEYSALDAHSHTVGTHGF